jgi:hypothetical protein
MPLTAKGAKIKAAMTKQYGGKQGEKIFYASRNKGTISEVDPQSMSGTPSSVPPQFQKKPPNATAPSQGGKKPSSKAPPFKSKKAVPTGRPY